MFYAHSGNSHTEVPMFVVGYEELYAEPEEGKEPTEVVGVRTWKFVFDRLHSDSHLVNKLIMENRSRLKNAGMAHCGNAKRSTKLVQEHARAVKLVGSSSTEKVALEYYAGNQYLRVTCLHDLLHLIESYGGVTDSFAGCLPIDLRSLPDGALNTPLKGHPDLGGDSYLGPEHAFCAKRSMAMRAGLVEFDSTPIRVHPDQLDPRFYFGPDGEFKIPPFLKTKNAFWFQSNPSIVHPYDMALPRPIAGIETPGKELLKLFAERENKWNPESGTDPTLDPNLVNLFKNMCTGIDQTTAKMLREATDTIFSFDATEVSDAERREASMAKAGAAKLGTVGILGEKGSAIIEPRQVMKQLGDELSTVVRKLIAPWEEDSRAKVAQGEGTAKKTRMEDLEKAKGNTILQKLAREKYKETLDGLRKESAELQKRYVRYKSELFDWGAEKFLRAFTSRYDRDSIPTGYRAVWDGLQAELKEMPNGSACIAMARDMQLTDSHKSAYSHAMNFYGRWCEHDCFFDGRDWNIMESIFFMLFEIATPTTTVTVVSGEPGTAKSMRFKRLMQSLSPGIIVQGGNKSARAGMQGNNDAQNGCLVYTDEMITALEENDGGEDLEFYKQGATERCITYQKATQVKTSDGLDGHVTATFRTWRWMVLAICTNRGGGFSRGNEEPSKVKQAMINRSQAVHVRKHDGASRPDSEFETHQGRPEVQRRRQVLRITTNLALLVRMMLLFQPDLRPDMTVAQRMWKLWDKRLEEKFGLVGIQRRRNAKRTEDCITACIWEAVWEVFVFKQTSVLYPSVSKKDAQGHLPPFHPKQLYEVIRILQPTHEIILDAWTRNMELSISTSRTGTNVMSILAEAHRFDFTDLLCRTLDENKKFDVMDYINPKSDNGKKLVALHQQQKAKEAKDAAQANGSEAAKKQKVAAAQNAQPADGEPLPIQTPRAQVEEAAGPNKAPPSATLTSLFPIFPAAGEDHHAPKLTDIHRASERLRVRREATSGFRTQCLNSSELKNATVDDLESLISAAGRPGGMQGVGGAAGGRGASSSNSSSQPSQTLDKQFSCIAPDVSILSIFYPTRNLLHWCINEFAGTPETNDPAHHYNLVSGTRADRHYVQLPSSTTGKTKYDFGWVRAISGSVASTAEGEGKGEAKLKGFADYRSLAKHLNGYPTQARFSYHEESIKDALYLLAHNEENSRMVPQMAYWSRDRGPHNAMKESPVMSKESLDGGAALELCPREYDPLEDSNKEKVNATMKEGQAKKRHKDSFVENSDLQRRVDAMVLRNRLFAASIVASNRINRAPPVRIMDSEVQVNAGILTDHCALLAEATLASASIPGLKNAHEKLPKSSNPPVGLTIPEYDASNGLRFNCDKEKARYSYFGKVPYPSAAVAKHGEATAKQLLKDDFPSERGQPPKRPREDGGPQQGGKRPVREARPDVQMESAIVSAKRKRDDRGGAASSPDDFDDEGNYMHDIVFALPYSHDIVSIHLSRSMGALLYDDELESEKKELVKTFGDCYGFPKDIEHAEVTLPFTGFLEHGRQLISIPRRTKPHAVDGVEPFRDEAEKKEKVRLDYVSACLGRRATWHDLREWAAQRAGSSQFYGITGNVFAQSVWRRHAIAALMSRGMIVSATETAANVVRYRSSQLFSRLVEYAANKQGSPYFAMDLKLEISEPNSYRAAEEEELGKIHDRAAKIARNEPLGDDEGVVEEESEALCRDVGNAWAAPSLLG